MESTVVVVVQVAVALHPILELGEPKFAVILVDRVVLEYLSGKLLRKVMHASCLNLHVVLAHLQLDNRSLVVHVLIQLPDYVRADLALQFLRIVITLFNSELGACQQTIFHVVGAHAHQPPPADLAVDGYQALLQFLLDKIVVVEDILEILLGVVVELSERAVTMVRKELKLMPSSALESEKNL